MTARYSCVLLTLGVLVLPCLIGCGYSTGRPFPDTIRTIHVEMFQTREFRRELEMRLTEAIAKRIEMDTPYRIASRKTADALMEGELISVDNRTFGTDFETDRPREIGTTVTVRYRVTDLRSGKILVERPRYTYQTAYIPPVGETFSEGMTRAFAGLAEGIVETMESSW